MGVTIFAKNSKTDFHMGYGGFFSLRKNIAKAIDADFGEHYATLIHCHTKEEYQAFDEKANRLLSEKRINNMNDVLDFLFMPDTDGKINYRTCGKIYELIKTVDFGGKCFTYAAYAKDDYERFKGFLKECYSKRRNMYWR